MTRALVLPPVPGRAVELATGGTRRVYRKKILPLGQLDYDGRTLTFDKPYLLKVKDAYDRRAFDHVPLQLATPRNDHNNDPELTRGVLQSLEYADGDGLYAHVGMGKRGAELVEEFPELAVSVRLIEDHEANGEHFDAALQHVLATWDPRVTRMGDWTPVDLSNSHVPVIDLSGLRFARLPGRKGHAVPPTPTQTYSRADLDAAVKAAVDAALAGNAGTNGEGGGPSDAELQALADEFFGDLTDGTSGGDPGGAGADGDDPDDAGAAAGDDARQLVEASRAHGEGIELAHSRLDDVMAQNVELTRERDEANWRTERQRYMRGGEAGGLPAATVDLARPLLEGKGREISLSNGDTVDVGAQLRKVLDSVVKTGLVDLSNAVGTTHEADDDETTRTSQVNSTASRMLTGLGYQPITAKA